MSLTLNPFLNSGYVTKTTYKYDSGWNGTVTQAVVGVPNSTDQNESTFSSYAIPYGGIPRAGIEYTFDRPVRFTYIGAKIGMVAFFGEEVNITGTVRLEGYVDQPVNPYWKLLASANLSGWNYPSAELVAQSPDVPFEYSGIRVTGYVTSTDGNTRNIYFYETSAVGNYEIDSGIRVCTSSGVKSLSGLPNSVVDYSDLRFYMGETIGLRLVDPTHAYASPLRIKTKNGVRAVALYQGL